MAFSSLIDRLIPEGATLPGSPRKTILADDGSVGGEPGYYDTSKIGSLLRELQRVQIESAEVEQKRQEREQKKMDMYKTLRSSGYDPKRAFEAVQKGQFPDQSGGDTAEEQKTQAEVDLKKAQEGKTKAETDKIIKDSTSGSKTAAVLRQEIIAKVAKGEELTPGEQKVYDEVIRKYGQKSDLSSILGDKKEASAATPEMVPMKDPAGKNKLVPKANVEKAKAKGWKLR